MGCKCSCTLDDVVDVPYFQNDKATQLECTFTGRETKVSLPRETKVSLPCNQVVMVKTCNCYGFVVVWRAEMMQFWSVDSLRITFLQLN